jgi:hypothetical protein
MSARYFSVFMHGCVLAGILVPGTPSEMKLSQAQRRIECIWNISAVLYQVYSSSKNKCSVMFVYGTFQLLIGVEDEDSCGRSGQCETPQACRGGSRVTRGKRSLARKSTAVLKSQIKINYNPNNYRGDQSWN